jgi:hypothetical protein
MLTSRVGQNHTFISIYGVHTVFLAEKLPYIRSYTVQIYGYGQLYLLELWLRRFAGAAGGAGGGLEAQVQSRAGAAQIV